MSEQRPGVKASPSLHSGRAGRGRNRLALARIAVPVVAVLLAGCGAGPPDDRWVERDFDGVVMVQVPAGCFVMGPDGTGGRQCFETPFWIDKYEVSNGQFAAFGGQAGRAGNWTDDSLPRERITWFEARDFCTLRGALLPTEAEWEYAARGPDGRMFPWGNEFVEENAVFMDGSGGGTAPVGGRPGGASWVGAQDMSGNVWEWTSSLYEPYPYNAQDGREADPGAAEDAQRVLRGGSFGGSPDFLRTTLRSAGGPHLERHYWGFRCVRPSS